MDNTGKKAIQLMVLAFLIVLLVGMLLLIVVVKIEAFREGIAFLNDFRLILTT